MASKLLQKCLISSWDLESGDESDIEEDAPFPLPRLDDWGDSQLEGVCMDESRKDNGISEEEEIESHEDENI